MKFYGRPIVVGFAICCYVIATRKAVVWPAPPDPFTISRCDQPFLFGFGTWQAGKDGIAAGSC